MWLKILLRLVLFFSHFPPASYADRAFEGLNGAPGGERSSLNRVGLTDCGLRERQGKIVCVRLVSRTMRVPRCTYPMLVQLFKSWWIANGRLPDLTQGHAPGQLPVGQRGEPPRLFLGWAPGLELQKQPLCLHTDQVLLLLRSLPKLALALVSQGLSH